MPLSPSSGPTCSWCRSQDGIRHRRHALEGSRRWWRCRSDEDAHLGCLEHSSTDRGALLGHGGDVAHLHRQWWKCVTSLFCWRPSCFIQNTLVLTTPFWQLQYRYSCTFWKVHVPVLSSTFMLRVFRTMKVHELNLCKFISIRSKLRNVRSKLTLCCAQIVSKSR